MGKKRQRGSLQAPAKSVPTSAGVPGILAGRASVANVIWLVLIAAVIGVSGGYLAYRLAGPAASPASSSAPDPTLPWRSRLLQNPEDVVAQLGLAHAHLDQGQLGEAEALYQRILAKEPGNVEAITHLGNVLLGRGEAEAALRRYDQALAIQPDYIHALWDKGHLLQTATRDYPGAIRVWEAFIRTVGPESQDARTAQGFIAEAREAMAAAPAPSPAPRDRDRNQPKP